MESRNRTYSEGNADDVDAIGIGCDLEVFKEYDEIIGLFEQLKNIYDNQQLSEKTTERFVYILNQYQAQPHLLDRYLDEFLNRLLTIARNTNNDKKLQHIAFKFLYIITKVRGYKIILRHLPHEVSDVEPVLSLLSEQNPQESSTWETRYMLLLWTSIVVMIPFHMHRLDDTSEDTQNKKKPIMERIMDVIKLYLNVSDKARDAAAFLASQFITRPDVKTLYLGEYLDWALKMLVNSENQLSFQEGLLSSLALLFKHGKREDMKIYGSQILKKILECGFKDSESSAVRKMALKLIQRIGLSFLRIKIANWRYCRGKRSLADNLAQGDVAPQLLSNVETFEDDEDYDIPDETEDIIEQLLVGLRDKDTIIRWSAAKGIGRITGRLPKELADDVVTSVLELFSLRESDSAWHGGCLALAELGRRGLILPQHLKRVVDVVLKALVYDEVRGNFSVGSHIRDAACYLCWSFARAYEPKVLQPYVNSIAGALLVAAVFDRSITCRRAASASFQENVGRQGTFPHGIEILTEADYYAVGSRQNSYLNLSVYIAQFPEYTLTLINHLLDYKINHWDIAIRELAAKALHNLTSKDPDYMSKVIIPRLLDHAVGIDLNARHGAILALAEIIHALACIKNPHNTMIDVIGLEAFEKIKRLVFVLDERGLFRGLGGILIRNAVCLLIEKASLAALPFEDEKLIVKWQMTLDSCLQHSDASVRTAAVSALPYFCQQYYPKDSSQCSKLLNDYLEHLNAPALDIRCGYALAIGALPEFMLKDHVSNTFQCLAKCTEITKEHANWAEARRDAIKAMSKLVSIIKIDPSGDDYNFICSSNLDLILNTFLTCMNDYTIDSRGEIGAIVREAAMHAIQDVTFHIVKTAPEMLSPDVVIKIFCAILQQCVEKIDRIRLVAGTVFQAFLHNEPKIPFIPFHEKLLEIFPIEICDEINWSSAADTFHHFVNILGFPCYTYNLLLGFIVSAGGLTESLVKYSNLALVNYLTKIQKENDLLILISDNLISILKVNIQNDRIVVPFFKMINYLLTSGIILTSEDQLCTFHNELLDFAWNCSYKSRDLQKIITVVDLFCNLLQFPNSCQQRALSRLTIFLCHRFPRVRKFTASQLYQALMTYDMSEEIIDSVSELLTETDWDESLEKLRPIRNNICEKLGIQPPKLKIKE